jgi:hypothetical protein
MPHEDADPAVAERLQKFTQTLPEAAEMNSKKLEEIFKDVSLSHPCTPGFLGY